MCPAHIALAPSQRRVGTGTLAGLVGKAGLDTDLLMRTLDLKGHAELALSHMDAAATRSLESFAAGVNAFIENGKFVCCCHFGCFGGLFWGGRGETATTADIYAEPFLGWHWQQLAM